MIYQISTIFTAFFTKMIEFPINFNGNDGIFPIENFTIFYFVTIDRILASMAGHLSEDSPHLVFPISYHFCLDFLLSENVHKSIIESVDK